MYNTLRHILYCLQVRFKGCDSLAELYETIVCV